MDSSACSSEICFSLSLKIIQNKRRKGLAEKSCEIAREKTDEVSKLYREIEKKLKIVTDIYSDWIEKEEFKIDTAKFYIAYYSNGYHQGLLEPDKYDGVKDFFTRVTMLRSKSTAKKMFAVVREK